MTQNIQTAINSIRDKAHALHGMLVIERNKSANLQEEILILNQQIIGFKERESALLESIEDLKASLEMANSQMVKMEMESTQVNPIEIDELVKEIEYCIGQLKK